MLRIQIDKDVTLEELNNLSDVYISVLQYGEQYVPAIKFNNIYFLLDTTNSTDDIFLNNNANKYSVNINPDLKLLLFYVDDLAYSEAKKLQNYLYEHGIMSMMICV